VSPCERIGGFQAYRGGTVPNIGPTELMIFMVIVAVIAAIVIGLVFAIKAILKR
jgi:hypothetical protein